MPVAITAMVSPSAKSAPLCAAASIPYAPPLVITQPRSTNPDAKSPN